MSDAIDHGDQLTDRQRRYVEGLVKGLDSQAAAMAAGYSKSFAVVAAYRLQKHPVVAKALATIRSDAAKQAAYTLLQHVKEIDWAIAGASAKDNWMAVARLVRDKGEVYGFSVEKIELVSLDLTKALAAAEARVFGNGVDITAGSPAHPPRWIPVPGGDESAAPLAEMGNSELLGNAK